MSHTNLIVELHIKEGQAESFIKMFKKEFVARSVKEEGCHLYQLWVNPEDRHKLTVVESWNSQGDLDRHMELDWFKEWGPKMEEMSRTPVQVQFLTSA